MISIGVTGTGSLIGQAIIKSIQGSKIKEDIDIIGLDYFANTVGSYWCKKNYILPDLLKEEITADIWLEDVLSIIERHKIQLLFVGVDFELIYFAKLKGQIFAKTGCQVVVSDERVIEIADDKYLTAEFLERNDLSYPKSFLNLSDAEDLQYPLIVKPRVGARSRGVSLVHDYGELEAAFGELTSPVIQECVGSKDEEFTCGVIFLDNKVVKTIALKRSLKEGNTFISSYSQKDDVLLRPYLANVAEVLKPLGACNFQLRLDDNNVPKIFEINARHSGTTFIRTLFGFCEVEYIICHYLNLNLPSFEIKEGTVVRYFDEFFVSL